MNAQIIESITKECVAAVEDLLKVHAHELDTALEMQEGETTISMSCSIDSRTDPKRPKVKTKLAFYTGRVRDERERVLDDNQATLF